MSTARLEARLRYRIADFDADEEVFFVTGAAADTGREEVVRIAPAELDGEAGIWVLAHGTRLPATTDGWAPPVVLPRSAAAALRGAGRCELRTGWNEGRGLVLEACELDDLQLDPEQITALRPWKKALLCARTPGGDALVAADARVAQLLVLRVDDACCIEWIEGELVGAREAPIAAQPARPDARGPAELVVDTSAPIAERTTAARQLAKKPELASFEALVRAQLGELEWKNQHEFATAASAVFTAASKAGVHFELAPLLREALERATEVEPDPEAMSLPPGPIAVAQGLMVHLVNRARSEGALDPDAEATMRRFASGRYASATVTALGYFGERGDADANDALSRLLGVDAGAAARALTRLDADQASLRYREQLAAFEASGAAHLVSNARGAMFSALQQAAPSWTDSSQRRAWVSLWESTADHPSARDKISSTFTFAIELAHAGPKPVGVIQVVRQVNGSSIGEAKAFVESLPRTLKTGLSLADAEAIEKRLLAAGATVHVK